MSKTALLMLAMIGTASIAAAAEPEAKPAAESEAMVDSPFFKVGWPKIEMPKISWKPSFGGDADPAAAEGEPGVNPVSRALDRVADSSRQASRSVRDAWGLGRWQTAIPGRSEQPERRVANADKQPGFWSRLLAPPEPKEAETVQEFLAQERIGTTR